VSHNIRYSGNPLLPVITLCRSRFSRAFGRWNLAIYCLMNSRRKMVNCSGRITVFSGIIASAKTGMRQKSYNRGCCGPGFLTRVGGGYYESKVVVGISGMGEYAGYLW